MSTITPADVITMFAAIAERIAADKERLCQLDGVIGDADHGITMDLGLSTVVASLVELDLSEAHLGTVFNTAAKSFLNAVGASSGPLYATAFMRAGASLAGKTTADDAQFITAFLAMAKGIEDRGKAVVGEKTMVDAWRPAADAAERTYAETGILSVSLKAAAEAARAGADATRAMVASKGRAARLGERALGHVDPGAESAALIIETMAGQFG